MTHTTQDNTGGDTAAITIGAAWMREQAAVAIGKFLMTKTDTDVEKVCDAEEAIRAIPLPTNADLLAEAMKLPEVAALVAAVTQELDARLIYEATPTDRGGNSGPKGTALTNWTRARATVAVALAPFTAAKETP